MDDSEVAEILIDAYRHGVVLLFEGQNLKYRGPREVINEELLAQLKQHKTELLNLLQKSEPLHYALSIIPIDNLDVEEPCLVGCSSLVRFHWRNGTGYGYCTHCNMNQLIETRVV